MSTRVDSRRWSVKPTCTGTLNSTGAGTKREYFASSGPGWQSASVLRRGHRLGRGDEVASGVLDAEFAHAVEGGADVHDNSDVFHGGKHSVQVINLHVEIRVTFSGFRGHGRRRVLLHAGVSLVHHFGGAFLKSYKAEFVPFRNFDGFRETETIDPERDDGLDLFDEQDWGDALDVHGFDLLR